MNATPSAEVGARPTWAEVDLRVLRENLERIRAAVAPAKVMPMVKANAYGHGLDAVARFIEPIADYFGVGIVAEGARLRKLGIQKPILVAGGTLVEELPALFQYDLTATVSSVSFLQAADALAEATGRRLKVHLKIDTGMERLGVHEYEAEPFLEAALVCRHLEVEGIYTHFANGEVTGGKLTELQLERFASVLDFYVKRDLPHPPLRHACNSGGILHYPRAYFDLVRPGLLFYGIYPDQASQRSIEVQPALTWRSRVVHSKITQPGRPVSYGSTWAPRQATRVITIPCGYADGYSRRMSNLAEVMVNGQRQRQVGRICMDQFMVDVGDDPVEVGDTVTLLGEGITAEELAAWSGTIPYETLTGISERVPRVYRTE